MFVLHSKEAMQNRNVVLSRVLEKQSRKYCEYLLYMNLYKFTTLTPNVVKCCGLTLNENWLLIKDKNIEVLLDKSVVLDFAEKIFKAVDIIFRYIPKLGSYLPVKFLIADSTIWLSRGTEENSNTIFSKGLLINNLVDINPKRL